MQNNIEWSEANTGLARSWCIQKRTGLICLLGLSLLLAACPSATTTIVDPDDEAIPVDTTSQFVASYSTQSHLQLTGPTDQLRVGTWVELVPRGPWPGAEASRPPQAVVQITAVSQDGAEGIVVGQRTSILQFDSLFGRVTERPTLPLSKSLTRVLSRADDEVRLAANYPEGVAAGDYFFVLSETPAGQVRLGSRIVALLQVTEVGAAGSVAQVIHQMTPFQAGDLALFAHHAVSDAARPEALILFTRTQPEVALDSFQLPPLANAVFDYQAEFGVSNIRIETLDVFVDPSAYNAADLAQDLAPEDGFGVIVFGHDQGDEFLYNITTYGATPSAATTVGILPGGLPLSTPSGLQGISNQLAPSFLATALTQRGDHAEVIYFLELCLREGRITGDVAFHAREHLALRFESIGRPLEGFYLMTSDIERAQQADNPYAELNALSIREFLDRQQYEFERELSDVEAFLEAADDVLPDESLLGERLERSRILGRLDRFDDAVEAIEDVIHQARRQQDTRWEVAARLSHANLLFQNDQIEEAIEVVNDTLSGARVVGDSYPRYSHALLAQYFAELDVEDQSLSNLATALNYANTDGGAYSQATTYELAANLNFNFDHIVEAVTQMRRAAEIYESLGQFGDLARTQIQTGMLELNAIQATSDPSFLPAAYNHLSQAAETYLALGDGLSAAQAYGGMGMINAALQNQGQALANFGGSIELGVAFNDPETVVIAYQRSAEIYLAEQEFQQAQLAIQAARLWAETFELTSYLGELDELEQYLQSAI